jgi:hypothetical protein
LTVLLLLGVSLAAVADPAGTAFDTGRFSVTVPAGWSAFQMDEADDTTVTVVKGGGDMTSLYFSPSISVMYVPLGTMLFGAQDLMDDAVEIEPFSLGGYDWNGYEYEFLGMKGISLTASGDFGSLVATISPQGMLGGDTITLEDADVRAILAGIAVHPFGGVDWAAVNEDGSLTVRLPLREGCTWETSMSGSFDLNGGENGPECEVSEAEEDGFYVATLTFQGSGAFSQGFSLSNDDGEVSQASVAVLCEDGKALRLADAYLKDVE